MKTQYSFITIVINLFTLIPFAGSCQITYPIAGTGVTRCYGNAGVINCPTGTSDAFYGQFQGTPPSYRDNGDGTVSDLVTGLMWMQNRSVKVGQDSAFILASQCTLGGYNDWRVPTIKELYSLINFNGKSGASASQCTAYIDTNFFRWTTGNLSLGERIIDAQDWSSNKYTGLTMNGDTTIFGVNFVDGRIKGYPKYQPPTNTIPQKMYVRFVRGNSTYGINNFTDNGDSSVTDNATGLMWAKYDDGNGMNWESALAYAQTKNVFNYLGHSDWRLPDAKELQSIVDYSRSLDATSSAAINPVFNCIVLTDEGGNTNYPFYWSSTTHLDNMGGVYIAFGEALGYMKMPPTVTYYTLKDVHGAGAQRSDPKSGSPTSYYLGTNQSGDPVYGLGPQGDVIRINNFVRLVRNAVPASVNENMDNRSFIVYPDPIIKICRISVNNENSKFKIYIYNTFGFKVRELDITGSTDVDLSDLTNGVYFLQIRTDYSDGFIKKIIVAK